MHDQLLNTVLAKVGRNLLAYQSLELSLKLVVAHAHPNRPSDSAGFDAFWEQFEDESLGALLKDLPKVYKTAGQPEQFRTYLRRIRDSRNELVHNFQCLSTFSMDTEAGLEEAIRYLDERYVALDPLLRSIQAMRLGFAHAHGAIDAAELKRLTESIGVTLEVRTEDSRNL